MKIIGLTGSIAMGKSTSAKLLKMLGIPVFEADKVVHELLKPGKKGALAVAEAFPEVGKGEIERAKLGRIVFENPQKLTLLEAILHPFVREREDIFLAKMARLRKRVVVLDIPLLLETHGDRRCHAVAVVSAPPFLQVQRALRRPGMTPARLAAILERQMPDAEKRRYADFVIPTGLGRRETLRHLAKMIKLVAGE